MKVEVYSDLLAFCVGHWETVADLDSVFVLVDYAQQRADDSSAVLRASDEVVQDVEDNNWVYEHI
jgi:hypothetical protein